MDAEVARIKKLLERSWDGPMWHGVNLMHILKDISLQQAFAKPNNATHNIYEYVQHMNAWRRFTVEQLKGNSDYRIEINSDQDWPTGYEATDENWQKALHDLEANQVALIAGIDNMKDEKLNEPVPGRKFKWYALLHGIIHHDISLSTDQPLKKSERIICIFDFLKSKKMAHG